MKCRACAWLLVIAALFLLSRDASAAPPSLGFGIRDTSAPTFTASLLLSPTSFGVGVEHFHLHDDELSVPSVRALELELFPGTGVGELRAGRTWHLGGGARWRLQVLVGATGLAVLKGPVSFGLGPHAGLFGSVGGTRSEVFLGAQAGAEGFFGADAGVRTPLRLVLGTRFGVGPVAVRLQARGGMDFAWREREVWRGELLLGLGLRLPVVTTEAEPTGEDHAT